MIVWVATTGLYKYIIEWKDGEFFTTTLTKGSTKLNHSHMRSIGEVVSWVAHSTNEDVLGVPE